MYNPELEKDKLEKLKREVEQKIGRTLKSPIDFDLLALMINKNSYDHISITTIKRLWGYVSSNHTPRRSTLSALSRYIGYTDWDTFCENLGCETKDEVDTCKLLPVSSKDLTIGDEVEMTWAPDCYCKIKYLGENKYVILDSRNSKIQIGITFSAETFYRNSPLIISNIEQVL